MKALIQLLVAGVFWIILTAQAQDANIAAGQVAETLGYPANRLIVTDESLNYAEKTKGQAIQVIGMESDDGTFASTAIAITK